MKENKPFGSGWKGMDCAPHDGSVVEIENRWGAKPWRALFRWTAENRNAGLDPSEIIPGQDIAAGHWVGATDPNLGFIGGAFAWRKFDGDPATHENPFGDVDDFDYVVLGMRPIAKLLAAESRRTLQLERDPSAEPNDAQATRTQCATQSDKG